MSKSTVPGSGVVPAEPRPVTRIELLASAATYVSYEEDRMLRLASLKKSKFRKPSSDPAELAARIGVRRAPGYILQS